MADTIAALSTPPATAAIGIIRLSGPQAHAIINRVFDYKTKPNFTPKTLVYGTIHATDGNPLDNCLVSFFTAPASYTGQDMVEIYCHGGLCLLNTVLETLFACGARQAEPGEFTKLAFLSGKLDLSQAEAVIDLIDAETGQQVKNAAAQLNGALGKHLAPVIDRLTDITAQFYAYVDFVDDEIEEIDTVQLIQALDFASERIAFLADSYISGQVMSQGVNCAIIGKPNVGKSSLINALSDRERSIVTSIAGTTRDVVTQSINIDGVKLNLADTAGIHQTEDIVENIGIQKAMEQVEKSDFKLILLDGSQPFDQHDQQVIALGQEPDIFVINKGDLPQAADISELFDKNYIVVSCKTGSNIQELKQLIAQKYMSGQLPLNGQIITNARHKELLDRALEFAATAKAQAGKNNTLDIILADIEACTDLLHQILGNKIDDQIVQRIFSRFCVGK